MSRAKSRSSFSSFYVWRETLSDSIPRFYWLTPLLFLIDRFSSVTYAVFPSSSRFGSAWIWAPFSATSVWHIVITAISLSLFPNYSYKLQRGSVGKHFWKVKPLYNTREAVLHWKINTSLTFSLQGLSGTVGHHTIKSKCQLILSQFPSSLELQSVLKCWGLLLY